MDVKQFQHQIVLLYLTQNLQGENVFHWKISIVMVRYDVYEKFGNRAVILHLFYSSKNYIILK